MRISSFASDRKAKRFLVLKSELGVLKVYILGLIARAKGSSSVTIRYVGPKQVSKTDELLNAREKLAKLDLVRFHIPQRR